MKRIALLLLMLLLAGCSAEPNTNLASSGTPLTIEAWKKIEVGVKYAPETLDRLKLNDPKLAKERNWNRFMQEVVVPERRKDIPTQY